MHPLVLTLVLLTTSEIAAPPVVDAPIDPRAADRATLTALKLEVWPAAYRDGDVDALRALLDDSFVAIDARGRQSTKSDELAWVAANRLLGSASSFRLERLEFLGPDAALITGLGTTPAPPGAAPTRHYRSTNVFVKRDGTWRAVASHVSLLPIEDQGDRAP